MIRRWFRHFAGAAITSYLAIFTLGFWWPEHMAMFLGQFGLGQIGRIVSLVIGVAWASAYCIWRYSRDNEA
jgi:hypothetical protein